MTRTTPVSIHRRAVSRLTTSGLALAMLVLAAGCRADGPSGPRSAEAPMTISAALAGTSVRALAIIVSGPAIPTPIVVNIDVSADVAFATTTIAVPVGGQRTFLARGFDASGEVTHEGMATVVVRPTGNAPVPIRMYPRTGDVPIVIGVGDITLAISPSPLPNLLPGGTRQLTATVTGTGGALVPGAVVVWGSLNPVVASVSPSGMVTAAIEGTTTLYATFQGVAASVDLIVGAGAPPPAPSVFRELAAGALFTCGIDTTDRAWCWGLNASGQLGADSETVSSATPLPVAGDLRFASITAGHEHACGITTSGEAWCWGLAEGRLGNGDANTTSYRAPQRVLGGITTWDRLFAGMRSTCGITTTGAAWCWGYGIGGIVSATGGLSTTPAPVSAAGAPWSGFTLGYRSPCAIGASGDATCWPVGGDNLVTTATAAGHSWLQLDVSDLTWESDAVMYDWTIVDPLACGRTTAREVRCWGTGLFGAMGDGNGDRNLTVPVAVAGPQGYDDLAVGDFFACGVRGGQAVCWGRNDFGQLGDGTFSDRNVPTPVSGGASVTRVTAGSLHACALRSDGAAICWGVNGWGELGDGTSENRRNVPVIVTLPTLTP